VGTGSDPALKGFIVFKKKKKKMREIWAKLTITQIRRQKEKGNKLI